jgi:hypothetical protein
VKNSSAGELGTTRSSLNRTGRQLLLNASIRNTTSKKKLMTERWRHLYVLHSWKCQIWLPWNVSILILTANSCSVIGYEIIMSGFWRRNGVKTLISG